MKLVTCKCPNCNASIKLNETLEKGTCNYCGAEVYNEKALTKEKIEISGELVIDSHNNSKKVDIAKKYYATQEYYQAYKLSKEVVENDPFNYEALKLIIQYIVECSEYYDISSNLDKITLYINRFKTVKKNSDDDVLLEKYEIKLKEVKDLDKITSKGMKIMLVTVLIFVMFLILLSLCYN